MNNPKDQEMDRPAEPTPTSDFRTPPRILIPKLVISRDKWKAKAAARKRQYRKEKIHSRDLEASRQSWKGRALAAEQKAQELRQQLQTAEPELAEARPRLAQ